MSTVRVKWPLNGALSSSSFVWLCDLTLLYFLIQRLSLLALSSATFLQYCSGSFSGSFVWPFLVLPSLGFLYFFLALSSVCPLCHFHKGLYTASFSLVFICHFLYYFCSCGRYVFLISIILQIVSQLRCVLVVRMAYFRHNFSPSAMDSIMVWFLISNSINHMSENDVHYCHGLCDLFIIYQKEVAESFTDRTIV